VPLDYNALMRALVDPSKIRHLMREIGRRVRGPGRVYLVGGASALLEGWRSTTVDVDLKLDPEPAGIFEAIGEIKADLDVNVELSTRSGRATAGPDRCHPLGGSGTGPRRSCVVKCQGNG
jgi:hypothetical protein